MSYVTQDTANKPIGMTAAIAINGSIIAAIMLSPMVMPPRTAPTGIKAIPIDAPKPPPDVVEPKDTAIITPIFTPKPLVEDLRTKDKPVTTTDEEPAILTPVGGSLGEGPVIAAVEIKKIIPEILTPTPIFKSAGRDPRFAGNFQPAYPTGLLQREIEGSVKIKVLIGTNGRVRQASILSASHPDFAAATEKQALKQWRFQPATRDGVPIEDWQTLTVRFNINN